MEFVRIQTEEGCESFVLATPEFVVRAWSDGPRLVGGLVEAVGFAGAEIIGRRRDRFTFSGTPEQFSALVRRSERVVDVVSDRRVKLHGRSAKPATRRPSIFDCDPTPAFTEKLRDLFDARRHFPD